MVIERQNEDIVIRLKAGSVDMREVQKVVDYFRFMESNAKNRGTEEQAAELAREAHAQWWSENKKRYLA
jgi:hypothetical protein